jgi:deazaflavin-dependent oxidoreductase (nitroreductase family)
MSNQISSSKVSSQVSARRSSQKAPTFMIPFMKMPLILYRLGLGWMLGKRFMRLTHAGRKSGKVYHTVLAVLRFDEQTQEIFAVSPWSESNWYRNIQAAPALEVETGDIRHGCIRYSPVQRSLTPEEIAQSFAAFRDQYPIFSRMVARIPGWKIDSTDKELLELACTLRGVAFGPKEE